MNDIDLKPFQGTLLVLLNNLKLFLQLFQGTSKKQHRVRGEGIALIPQTITTCLSIHISEPFILKGVI